MCVQVRAWVQLGNVLFLYFPFAKVVVLPSHTNTQFLYADLLQNSYLKWERQRQGDGWRDRDRGHGVGPKRP